MNKSIFIIGAGPGIGRSTAARFAREGWRVIAADRDRARLDGVIESLGAEGLTIEGIVLDATDPGMLRGALAAANARAGGLDAIHYNAAIVRAQTLFAMTDAEVTTDLAINVAGALHTIRAAVDLFEGRGGTILLTGGGLATDPHPSYASLGAGKAAVRNVVRGLASDLAKRNIHIAIATVATLVAPGSPDAEGVADTLFRLATGPGTGWELRYPAAS